MKTHAFRLHVFGDESVLEWEEVELGAPGPGQVLIRHTAVGVNFADIYMRQGHFHHQPKLPTGLGLEGAGVIEAVGPDVQNFTVGQRVGYAGGGTVGSYAQARIRSTDGLIALPDWMDDKVAAASFSKGMTVQYLFNRTHKLAKGDVILFTAAAGGVGLIASQWARAVGATMIGTVSSEEKAALALKHGCAHVIVTSQQNVTDEVMRITQGKGVDVVYDSIGKDSWADSLASVRRLGLVVLFGTASGAPPPFDVLKQGSEKSIYVTRATTVNYMTDNAIRQASADHLFEMIHNGKVNIVIGRTYPLRDLPQAHRDIAARRTTGSVVLIP
jgi:NADPH2:quinone reductase